MKTFGLEKTFLDTNDNSFRTGNTGISFAYIIIGSLTNDERLYDKGINLLESNLINAKAFSEKDFLFFSNSLVYLIDNDFIDLDEEFFLNSIDSYFLSRIGFCEIDYKDLKVFLYLRYIFRRKSLLFGSLDSMIMATKLITEIIIHLDNHIAGNATQSDFHTIKYAYYCSLLVDDINDINFHEGLKDRLKRSIENLLFSLYDKEKVDESLNKVLYSEMAFSQNGKLSLSQNIQLNFLNTNHWQKFLPVNNLEDFFDLGLLNSSLGLWLAEALHNDKTKQDINFFIQY